MLHSSCWTAHAGRVELFWCTALFVYKIRYPFQELEFEKQKKKATLLWCVPTYQQSKGHEVNIETFLNHLIQLAQAILILSSKNNVIWIESSSLKRIKSWSILNSWKAIISKPNDTFREEVSYCLQYENLKCSAHFLWWNNSVFQGTLGSMKDFFSVKNRLKQKKYLVYI